MWILWILWISFLVPRIAKSRFQRPKKPLFEENVTILPGTDSSTHPWPRPSKALCQWLPPYGGKVQVLPGTPYIPRTLAMLSDPDGISQPSPLADCSCCRLFFQKYWLPFLSLTRLNHFRSPLRLLCFPTYA
jgi:hypothetical protein